MATKIIKLLTNYLYFINFFFKKINYIRNVQLKSDFDRLKFLNLFHCHFYVKSKKSIHLKEKRKPKLQIYDANNIRIRRINWY